jgi:hypothetical protein
LSGKEVEVVVVGDAGKEQPKRLSQAGLQRFLSLLKHLLYLGELDSRLEVWLRYLHIIGKD